MQAKEIMNLSLEMENGKKKRQKVQENMAIRSLFDNLPDEMVLTILSYGEMVDIQNTRGWQSKNVQHCTETIWTWVAAENNNLDNLKWIYGYIGKIEFKTDESDDEYDDEEEYDETGNRLPNSCTGI